MDESTVYFMGSPCGQFIKIGTSNTTPHKRYEEHRKKTYYGTKITAALVHVRGERRDEQRLLRYFAPYAVDGIGNELFHAAGLISYVAWLRMQWFSRHDHEGRDLPVLVPFTQWEPNPARISETKKEPSLFDDETNIWDSLPIKRADAKGEEDYYSPECFVEITRMFFHGRIDLDPASHYIPQSYIRAERFYDDQMNGLQLPWNGRVYLVPPFDPKLTARFLLKAIEEYKSGRVSDIVTILEASKPHTNYAMPFLEHCMHGVCLIAGREKWKGMGGKNPPRHPYVAIYTGNEFTQFKHAFSQLGYIR